jgi:hypothetical protein
MAVCSPLPTAGQEHFVGTMPTHAIDERWRVVATQVVSQVSGVMTPSMPVTGVTDGGFGNNTGRIGVPLTAGTPVPQGTSVSVMVMMDLAPLAAGETGVNLGHDVHPGDPALGDSYFFVNTHSRLTGPMIPPTLNSFFDVFQCVSLDGIDAGLGHHKFQISAGTISVTPVTSTQFAINFMGQFPVDPMAPGAIGQARLNIDGVGSAFGAPGTVRCPRVLASPDGVTVDAGTDVRLDVVIDGDAPLSYQWRKGGVAVPVSGHYSGANSAELTIVGATPADNGSYDCVVTNSCGMTTSGAAVVTVYCRGDFNHSGAVTVQDIFDFLAAYFGPC